MIKKLRRLRWRLYTLITRKLVWENAATGEKEIEHASFDLAWTLAGVHSHNWLWVSKYGKMECGCTRNPITRRLVLILSDCKEHCRPMR